MKLSGAERIKRFFSCFSNGDKVLVLVHADPDAIASAMAVKRLLWKKVAGVTLSTVNPVKRPDNLAMIRLLGVNLHHIDDVDTNRFTRYVLVDSQPNHHDTFKRFDFHVVIDHHPLTAYKKGYMDIRPEYGATATILTEYLRAAKINPPIKLATGLVYAIKTDTDNFERKTTIEDVRAFQFLFRRANLHLINKIDQAELQPSFLKYFQRALTTRKMRRGRMFIHLGNVPTPDICVLVADFFMKVATVKWSIVSGINKGKLIIIFRNDGIHKNAGRLAESSFGHLGSAGGHKCMARAEIPINRKNEKTPDFNDENKVLNWIIKRIEKRN